MTAFSLTQGGNPLILNKKKYPGVRVGMGEGVCVSKFGPNDKT